MFEICYSLWYGAAALSGKAGSERLLFVSLCFKSERKCQMKVKYHTNFQPDRVLSYFQKEWKVLLAVTVSGLIYNIGLLAGPWFEGKMTGCLVDILKGVALVAYAGMLLGHDFRLALLCMIFPPISYMTAEKMKKMIQRTGAAYKEQSGYLSTAILDRAENHTCT